MLMENQKSKAERSCNCILAIWIILLGLHVFINAEIVYAKPVTLKTMQAELKDHEKEVSKLQAKYQTLQEKYEDQCDTMSTFFGFQSNDTMDLLTVVFPKDYAREISSTEKSLKKAKKLADQTKKVVKKLKTEKQKEKEMKQEKVVFDAEDVTTKSHITTQQLKNVLSGTGLEDFADTYVKIEQRYGVNALAICSISALESGWGTSERAIKDHNYTGFGVYSAAAEGINAESGEENLIMTAKHLYNNYLQKDGKYYEGLSLEAINKHYCVGNEWHKKVTNIGKRLVYAINRKIPINEVSCYQN